MDIEKMQIIRLADNTAEAGLKDAEERGLRLLTPEEHNALVKSKKGKQFWGSWYWTSMRMKYAKGSTEAETQIVGEKPQKTFLPLEDGYYTSKSFGLPNGEKSTSDNPDALYLYRRQSDSFEGLVARGYDRWGIGYRRLVGCVCRPDDRLGVLIKREVKE